MAAEADLGVSDIVTAELVDCPVDAPEPSTLVLTFPETPSPVEASREATLEQTGAGPPPKGVA